MSVARKTHEEDIAHLSAREVGEISDQIHRITGPYLRIVKGPDYEELGPSVRLWFGPRCFIDIPEDRFVEIAGYDRVPRSDCQDVKCMWCGRHKLYYRGRRDRKSPQDTCTCSDEALDVTREEIHGTAD